jgi:hypothetical protein
VKLSTRTACGFGATTGGPMSPFEVFGAGGGGATAAFFLHPAIVNAERTTKNHVVVFIFIF